MEYERIASHDSSVPGVPVGKDLEERERASGFPFPFLTQLLSCHALPLSDVEFLRVATEHRPSALLLKPTSNTTLGT